MRETDSTIRSIYGNRSQRSFLDQQLHSSDSVMIAASPEEFSEKSTLGESDH